MYNFNDYIGANLSALYGNVSLSDSLYTDFMDSQFLYHKPENIVLISIYIPVFLLALISNVLVIAVFIKHRSFRTVTNCLLMNLSVADLQVTIICMPSAIGGLIWSPWLFGEFFCKAHHYLQGVSVGSSVLTLTVMGLDRYVAIRHPLKRKNFVSKRLAIKVIIVVWIVSLAIFSPILFVRNMDTYFYYSHKISFCYEHWGSSTYRKLFGVVVFVLVYLAPGIIIVAAYTMMGCTLRRSELFPDAKNRNNGTRCFQIYTIAAMNLMKERRKVARTLMILAFAFALCWLPSSVFGLILDFSDPSEKSEDEFFANLHKYCLLLGHFNSLLNPLLYSLMTKNFRKHVKDLLICKSNSNG